MSGYLVDRHLIYRTECDNNVSATCNGYTCYFNRNGLIDSENSNKKNRLCGILKACGADKH